MKLRSWLPRRKRVFNHLLAPVDPVPSVHRCRHPLPIEPMTGPLSTITRQKILVLADVENLSCSARERGFKLSYRTLAVQLCQKAKACSLHAFFSREPGDERLVRYFLEREWTPHPRDIETVRTHSGLRRETNSDNLILFMAGVLSSRSNANAIVLGSGDGKLVSDLASALSALPKPRQVVTLSLAGSTGQRLNAAIHPHIGANIEIGRDCLHALPQQRPDRHRSF